MSNDDKILKALQDLQAGQKSLEAGQKNLQADVSGLKATVKGLNTKVDAVELKVEEIHAYQKKAHTEIMDSLFESNEVNSHTQKVLEKRIERIEKHLGLPPLK